MRGQTEAIYNHLCEKGSITSMEAFEKYGATRLSAIIFRLRKDYGKDIETRDITIKNRFGENCTFAKYVLNKEAE